MLPRSFARAAFLPRSFSRFAFLVALAWAGPVARLAAQAPPPPHDSALDGRQRWWYAGFHLGVASLRHGSDQAPLNTTANFAMAITAGFNVTPQWRVGAELGGFLIRPGSDVGPPYSLGPDTTGAGIMQLFATAQWYPQRTRDWFVRAGGGYAEQWDQRAGNLGSSGWGSLVGAGYDWRTGPTASVSLTLNYAWGRLGDARGATLTSTNRRYEAIELRVGISAH